jgi:hypothetical protein
LHTSGGLRIQVRVNLHFGSFILVVDLLVKQRCRPAQQRQRLALRGVVDLVLIGPRLVLAAVIIDQVELGTVRVRTEQLALGVYMAAALT